MQLQVDTESLAGLAEVVRSSAAAVATVALPRPPACADLAAADAIGALLAVSAQQLHLLAGELAQVARLVDTAQRDYALVEARVVPGR